jgi:hypothetical protein
MECAQRVVIILVICSSISSARSLSRNVQDQENQYSGTPARIVGAITRHLIHDSNSEDNSRRDWSFMDRLIATEYLSSLGSLYSHREGEDQNAEAMFPAQFMVKNEKRDSGGNSLRDNRIQDAEGETT